MTRRNFYHRTDCKPKGPGIFIIISYSILFAFWIYLFVIRGTPFQSTMSQYFWDSVLFLHSVLVTKMYQVNKIKLVTICELCLNSGSWWLFIAVGQHNKIIVNIPSNHQYFGQRNIKSTATLRWFRIQTKSEKYHLRSIVVHSAILPTNYLCQTVFSHMTDNQLALCATRKCKTTACI